MFNAVKIIGYIRTSNINLINSKRLEEKMDIKYSKYLLQVPIDELVDLNDNKKNVKHQKYLFLIELISKNK